jgi:hypothetical protein
VFTPISGVSNVYGIPSGVQTPFYVNANDESGIASCSLMVDGAIIGTVTVPENGSYRFNIALISGAHVITASCRDLAGNVGFSPLPGLSVVAINSDAGIATDTQVADTLPVTDTTQSGCIINIGFNVSVVPHGQTLVCAAGVFEGVQTCFNGTLSPCVPTGTAESKIKAAIDCRLNKIELTGNVIGNLFPSKFGNTRPVTKICLIGDGEQLGGMSPENGKNCLSYTADSSRVYTFNNFLLTTGGAYRITFIGFTDLGEVRWANNNPDRDGADTGGTNGNPLLSSLTGNLCKITREVILGGPANLLLDAR